MRLFGLQKGQDNFLKIRKIFLKQVFFLRTSFEGFAVYSIKTEDFYKDIADDVVSRFDTSGYVPDRPLPVGLNKKVIGLMKDELGGEIMREFVSLQPKMYSYTRLVNRKAKSAKESRNVLSRKL